MESILEQPALSIINAGFMHSFIQGNFMQKLNCTWQRISAPLKPGAHKAKEHAITIVPTVVKFQTLSLTNMDTVFKYQAS